MHKILTSLVFLTVLLIGNTKVTFAQFNTDNPLEIKIQVGNQSIKNGETTEATIILNNYSPYPVSVSIESTSNNILLIKNISQNQLTIPPYGSNQIQFDVAGKDVGKANLTFLVKYNWIDSLSKQEHSKTETLISDSIDITGFRFDWPGYIIPLVIGFVFGQLGIWVTNWQNVVKEEQVKIQLTIGITLAALRIIQKGLERKEAITFTLWEDMVLKGNLYPFVIKLGKKIKEQKLATRLTDLIVMISEYNNRRAQGNLSEDFVIDLSEEIDKLIKVIEQVN